MVNPQSIQTSLVIQAGGESRRMGQNKALMPFLGRPLIERVIERVRLLGDEVLLTSNQPNQFSFLKLPVYPDVFPGQGALSGLYTALSVAKYPLVAVVACDLPFASLKLLQGEREQLISESADAVVPRLTGGFEPFHALYRRETCLPAVRAALQAGEKRLISWFPQVKVSILPEEQVLALEPAGLTFFNVNTPEEARLAEKLVREHP